MKGRETKRIRKGKNGMQHVGKVEGREGEGRGVDNEEKGKRA